MVERYGLNGTFYRLDPGEIPGRGWIREEDFDVEATRIHDEAYKKGKEDEHYRLVVEPGERKGYPWD